MFPSALSVYSRSMVGFEFSGYRTALNAAMTLPVKKMVIAMTFRSRYSSLVSLFVSATLSELILQVCFPVRADFSDD